MSGRDAVRLAQEHHLDLVEISPQARPPVCKILDYGKYRYEQQKREKDARKNIYPEPDPGKSTAGKHYIL